MENNETIKIKVPSLFDKIPKHNWAIITYLLIIIILLLFLSNFPTANITGNVISERDIEHLIEDYINTELIPEVGAVVSNIREESGIYVATITIDGQSVPAYFTKDGKFITQGTSLISIEGQQTTTHNLDNIERNQ